MTNYEITITKDAKTSGTGVALDETFTFEAPSVLSAMEKVHKEMQKKRGVPYDSYAIKSAAQLYFADSRNTELVRSFYDLPKSSNPNLSPT